MKKSFGNVSKLLLVAGCVSVLASGAANAAPLVYGVDQPSIRSDYSAPNKIRLEGDVQFLQASDQKINLSLRDTDVQQVLRMFADKAGMNIVFHSSAKGLITLDLVDVSLEDAFKMVMKMTNLTYAVKGKTLMIVGTDQAESLNLTKDNINILPVKYADAAYLAQFLNANVFRQNAPGLSYGPIVTTNAERNELLIFGSDNDYIMAKKIVEKFDVKPAMTTYRVNHTTPNEMAKMICETLFRIPEGDTMSAGSGGNMSSKLSSSLTAGTSSSASTEDGTLGGGQVACVVKSSVTTDNLTSYMSKPSLILYSQQDLGTLTLVGGSEYQIQMVNDFILQNDRKQPQAYLEITIAQLSESGSKQLGFDWNFGGDHVNLGFTNGAFSMGELAIIGGGGIRYPNRLLVQLKAVLDSGKGKILANPKIVITNGQKSTIDLTEDYIESTTIQYLSSTSSGGTTTGTVQKTYEIGDDNGIKVEVTPFISPDGYVSLDLKPDYASVKEQINDYYYEDDIDPENAQTYIAATLLQRNNLELKRVRIKDDETLLIGGMIRTEEADTVNKVPILGDLPGIGFLFRNTRRTTSRYELVYMITPHIIKDTEDIADL
ncbi:MAG: hypothetical protein LUG16_04605 [Candidatus Gastranaerophilales bacterium]|nr:hypothetical protein [Candidatus Gastranaerophilales bacterium]